MTMPRASFVSVLAFVAAVAGGSYLLEVLATRVGVAVAHADTVPVDAAAPTPDAAAAGSGSGSAMTAVGSASSTTVSTTTTITNSDQLHDILSDPFAAYQDLKTLAAVKLLFPILAGFIMLTRIVARLPGKIGAWFATGYRATVISISGIVAVAVFNVAVTGAGVWTLILVGFGALFTLVNPIPAPNTRTKAA